MESALNEIEEITFFKEFENKNVVQMEAENAHLDIEIYKLQSAMKEFVTEQKKLIKDLNNRKDTIISNLMAGGQVVTTQARKVIDLETKMKEYYDLETGDFCKAERMTRDDFQLSISQIRNQANE